jgi:hypothetical protein
METMTIVEFLTARLDEREAAAKAATPGPWRYNPQKHTRHPRTTFFEEAVFAGPSGKDAIVVAATGEDDDPQSMDDAIHIAANDPAYTLADIAAKRAIIADYERVWESRRAHPEDMAAAAALLALHGVVQLLVSPYADHPDYRSGEKP